MHTVLEAIGFSRFYNFALPYEAGGSETSVPDKLVTASNLECFPKLKMAAAGNGLHILWKAFVAVKSSTIYFRTLHLSRHTQRPI